MIEFLADDYDIWGGYMIHKDWVYKNYNMFKPIVMELSLLHM